VLDARYIRSFFSLFARCFGVCVLRLLTRLSTDGPSRLRILLYEEWRTTRLLRAGLELGGWGMVRPPRKVREIEENSFPFLITFTSVLVIRIGSIRCSSHHGPFSTCGENHSSLFVRALRKRGGDLLEGIVWLGVRAWVRECCRGFTGDGWECGCGGVTFI
jgi:hypothetical protein